MMWKLWAKALGSKEGASDSEADRVAWIRTAIVVQAIITNGFIIANFFVSNNILN